MQGKLQLAGCICFIAITWCVVLPELSRQPAVAEHLNQLKAAGIDPSAMFYSELDAMEPLLNEPDG